MRFLSKWLQTGGSIMKLEEDVDIINLKMNENG
jgi:hypothetical protein